MIQYLNKNMFYLIVLAMSIETICTGKPVVVFGMIAYCIFYSLNIMFLAFLIGSYRMRDELDTEIQAKTLQFLSDAFNRSDHIIVNMLLTYLCVMGVAVGALMAVDQPVLAFVSAIVFFVDMWIRFKMCLLVVDIAGKSK